MFEGSWWFAKRHVGGKSLTFHKGSNRNLIQATGNEGNVYPSTQKIYTSRRTEHFVNTGKEYMLYMHVIGLEPVSGTACRF